MITYRQLLEEIQQLTEDQLDKTVTTEDAYETVCHEAELRICGDNHHGLSDGHPVIFIP